MSTVGWIVFSPVLASNNSVRSKTEQWAPDGQAHAARLFPSTPARPDESTLYRWHQLYVTGRVALTVTGPLRFSAEPSHRGGAGQGPQPVVQPSQGQELSRPVVGCVTFRRGTWHNSSWYRVGLSAAGAVAQPDGEHERVPELVGSVSPTRLMVIPSFEYWRFVEVLDRGCPEKVVGSPLLEGPP